MSISTFLTRALPAFLLLSSPVAAQELSPELEALNAQLPGQLINDPTRLDWDAYGSNFKSKGIIDPSIPGGGAAIQFDVKRAGANPYDVSTNVPLVTDIAQGDTLTIGFYARTVSADTLTGKGVVTVRFQRNAAPYPGFGETLVEIGTDWDWYEVSGTADINVKKRDAVIALQLAGAKQKIEIGQAIVVKGVSSIVAPQVAEPASVPAPSNLPAPLQNAGRLINSPDQRGWGHNGPSGSFADRDDDSIWLGKSTRFTVAKPGQERWDVGTAIPLTEGIAAGDRLIVAIAARTLSAATDDGKALIGFRMQDSQPPYAGFGDELFKVGSEWQLIQIPVSVTRAITANRATVALHFSGAAQEVDIGPVFVLKVE